MITLSIKDWDKKRWTDFTDWHRRELQRRFTALTGLQKREVKRLVKKVKHREALLLPLPNAADALASSTLCSFLESLGAIVEIAD